MIDYKKIVKFLLVNGFGFYVTPFILTAAVKFGFFPHATDSDDPKIFEFILGGGMWFWLAGCLASIGYFFVSGKTASRWLVLAPVYCPLLYNTATLFYLNLK